MIFFGLFWLPLVSVYGAFVAVRIRHAGDDPDEIWFQCIDCEGTGRVSILDGEDESLLVQAECPGCAGVGGYEGDPDMADDADETIWI